MDLGWREQGVCKVCNYVGTPGRGEKMEERRSDMEGNTDLRNKKSDHRGQGGREGGWASRSRRLIEEIGVRVREMRKENNETGSTARMKIEIKITFVNQFASSG